MAISPINKMIDAVEIEIAVNQLPFEQYKNHEVDYGVQYRPGIPYNFSLNGLNTKAGYKQNPYKHNTQMKELIKEGMLSGLSLNDAIKVAEEKEKILNADYWNKDTELRKPLGAGSSVIREAKINEDGNIDLTFKNNKKYTYSGGIEPDKSLMELLTSHSIGNQISKKPGNWASRHKRG